MKHDLSQLTIIIMCDDSTGCDEVDDYFSTEIDTIMEIVCENDLDKD